VKRFVVDFGGEEEMPAPEVPRGPKYLIFFGDYTAAARTAKHVLGFADRAWVVKYTRLARGDVVFYGAGVGDEFKPQPTNTSSVRLVIGETDYFADDIDNVKVIDVREILLDSPEDEARAAKMPAWKRRIIAEFEERHGVRVVELYDEFPEILSRWDGFEMKSIAGEIGNGESHWFVFRDEDHARAAAIEILVSEMEEDPNGTYPDVIWRYLSEDDFEEIARNRAADTCMDADLLQWVNEEEWDEANEAQRDRMMDVAMDDCIDDEVRTLLDDGIREYFENRYGGDALTEAIRRLGVDFAGAADQLVNDNGVGWCLDVFDNTVTRLFPSGALAYGRG
jgi:hypothetical protein